ncbi:MAG: glycosyltransferase family 9 protein [Bacteroidia bacterium]|nr:glycosyltransferase family 9 protein [Bacteroidia bacterium]
MMSRFLIVQTAFVGDAILMTALLEKLHVYYPQATLDVLVRKGNESLFDSHPFIGNVLIWDKKQGKYKSLFTLINSIRKKKYDTVINVQRFFNAGMLTAFSGANKRIGFNKSPWSFAFTTAVTHQLNSNLHEVERNQQLITALTDNEAAKPKLYTNQVAASVQHLKQQPYVCMAPASVWFTKQWPKQKWIELCNEIKQPVIYLIGAPADNALCDEIKTSTENKGIVNLAGKLSLLQSASLMQQAVMNYVNDSAPMHLCSATDAPVTAIFCSTIPAFGFGPLSTNSKIAQTGTALKCRPCGLHGHKQCPQSHFNCAYQINIKQVL